MTMMSAPTALEISIAVVEARSGDEAAFTTLMSHFERLVYGLCLRIVKTPEVAQDATQETFIAAWRNISKANPKTFRAWLCTIAANTSRTELRKARRRSEVALAGEFPFRDTDAPLELQVVQRELRRTLDRCLDSLTFAQRDAVELWHFAGLDYATIALITEVPVGTVKSRISRGREELTRRLFDERYEWDELE